MSSIIEFDYKKAIQAINFFAVKNSGRIDKIQVIKLTWLADRYHLRKYGRPIINDTYYAMEWGPVGSFVKDLLSFDFIDEVEKKYIKKYLKPISKNKIISIKTVDEDVFSSSDIEVLAKIYKEYGKYKPFTLARFSHEFPEWKKFEQSLSSKEKTREIMSYDDFFLNPTKKTKLKNIFTEKSSLLKNSNEIFKENYEIANFWV